jgi:hypothetical protein
MGNYGNFRVRRVRKKVKKFGGLKKPKMLTRAERYRQRAILKQQKEQK